VEAGTNNMWLGRSGFGRLRKRNIMPRRRNCETKDDELEYWGIRNGTEAEDVEDWGTGTGKFRKQK
jgi:hypothetical protein